jgi:hypothetical protein
LLLWLGLTGAGWSEDAAVTAATPAKKTFWVEKEMVDAGVVLAGREAEATFVFHNDGDQPVKIIKAKPT